MLRHPLVPDAALGVVLINNLWFEAPQDLGYVDRHLWLIRELRAISRGFLTVMSGYGYGEGDSGALEAGADQVLALPYTFKELAEALRAAVAHWKEAGRGAFAPEDPASASDVWWDGHVPSTIVALPPAARYRHGDGKFQAVPLTVSPDARNPRIVMLDDVSGVLELLELLMRSFFPGAEILTFLEADKAYAELLRQPPDLFTPDACHLPPDGEELLRMLSVQSVDYPIVVISSCVSTADQLRPGSVGPGMDVTFLPKPFRPDELANILREKVVPRL